MSSGMRLNWRGTIGKGANRITLEVELIVGLAATVATYLSR